MEIRTILESETGDGGMKSKQLRQHLKQRRFPNLTAKLEMFNQLVKKMSLGSAVRLSPPRDFEGNTYTATLKFQSVEELEERKQSLERILRGEELKEFLGT